MARMSITGAYHLRRLRVKPSDLLLDPTNPRLVSDGLEREHYSTADLTSPGLQETVLKQVCRKEHHIAHLIEAIRQNGFLGGLHGMIVKRLDGGGRHLVLEGNRRTAALQHLLKKPKRLNPDVLRSIRQIEVQEFVYDPNDVYEEEEVVDVLLGSIHIDGPEEWGAMNKARYVHRRYDRSFGREHPGLALEYRKSVAEAVGELFNMKPLMVRRLATVHRVYEQLLRGGFPVRADHYSLIDLACKTRGLKEDYFEVDVAHCKMSEVGLERMSGLCLGDNAPVHNPGLFKDFTFVWNCGNMADLHEAEESEDGLRKAKRRIQRRLAKDAFLEELQGISGWLASLRVADYRGTTDERREIAKIRKLVGDRLAPLSREARATRRRGSGKAGGRKA